MELEIYSQFNADGHVQGFTWNHEEIKREVAEKIKHYAAMVYTEDQVKDAKADMAKLRKFVTALESKRKELKKKCLEPYEAFERQVKEITALVSEPIDMIDRQVKGFEETKKAEKMATIEAYWASLAEEGKIPDGITLDQIFSEKWLNATASLKSVFGEIDARLEQIKKDLATLATMPEFAFEATEVYKHTLDINEAISEGKRLLDLQKRKAEATAPAKQEAADDQARAWVGFRAYLSTAEAMALKEFFTARNIKFESIKQTPIVAN